MPFQEFYLLAFNQLSSERHWREGQVPWGRIDEYGRRAGLDADIIDSFVVVIRTMDGAFLEWQAEQDDKRRRELASR